MLDNYKNRKIMKRIYQKPTLVVVTMNGSLPIATSISINNVSQNGVQGDVKGDWSDIWDDPDIGEE